MEWASCLPLERPQGGDPATDQNDETARSVMDKGRAVLRSVASSALPFKRLQKALTPEPAEVALAAAPAAANRHGFRPVSLDSRRAAVRATTR
jgi:hypothetical protein